MDTRTIRISNKERVLHWLRNHDHLTVRDATLKLDLNGGTFTKVISELIKDGFDIRKYTTYRVNASGVRKHFTVYELVED